MKHGVGFNNEEATVDFSRSCADGMVEMGAQVLRLSRGWKV